MVVIAPDARQGTGGLKGFLSRATHSLTSLSKTFTSSALSLVGVSSQYAFIASSLFIVVFFPLILEIAREGEVLNLQKLEVQELKKQGYGWVSIRAMDLAKRLQKSRLYSLLN